MPFSIICFHFSLETHTHDGTCLIWCQVGLARERQPLDTDMTDDRLSGLVLTLCIVYVHAQIPGTIGVVGTSNIAEHSLPFDLSVFKSVLQIEVRDISFVASYQLL